MGNTLRANGGKRDVADIYIKNIEASMKSALITNGNLGFRCPTIQQKCGIQ